LKSLDERSQYVKGSHNTVADALSRLPCFSEFPTEEIFAVIPYDPIDDFPVSFAIISKYQLKDEQLQSSFKNESRIMHKSNVIF
jgi:hypothetical protein